MSEARPPLTNSYVFPTFYNIETKSVAWQDEKKGCVFTNLSGYEHIKLLECLPKKLEGILHGDTQQSIIAAWKTFQALLVHIKTNPTGENVEAKDKHFLDVDWTWKCHLKGYGKNWDTHSI